MNAVKHKNVELCKMLIRGKANLDLQSQTNVGALMGGLIQLLTNTNPT